MARLKIYNLKEILYPIKIDNTYGIDIIHGLNHTSKYFPSHFLYDQNGSQLFEQICQLPEYYLTRIEASLLTQHASSISEITGACDLLELGSGSSTKTRFLLDAYSRKQRRFKYVPIDVSGSMLMSSSIQLLTEYPNLRIEALEGTYEQALNHLERARSSNIMIIFLGSSIGNLGTRQCDRFFQQIARTLSPGGYFLLGIDLCKSKKILESAYNDSQGLNAAFALNILEHINREFNGDFDTNLFTYQAIYNEDKDQMEMYLYCEENHTVQIEALNYQLRCRIGERILTEISRKFDLDSLQRQLASHGFKTLQTSTDPERWFGLILCQVIR